VTLILIVSTANSQHLEAIILEPPKVSGWTTKSGHMSESANQRLTYNHLASSVCMDQQHQVLCDRIDALGKSFLSQHLRDPEVPSLDQMSSLPKKGALAQTVRVVTSRRLLCRSWCPCICNTKRKLKLTTARNSGGYA
jgi:hypothetical protein